MKRILHLTSSINGDASYSLKLGRAIVEKIQQAHPGSTVDEVNLVAENVPHLTPITLQAFFTPADQLVGAATGALQFSNEAVARLLASDVLVIGAPLYNFGIHSALKAWLDHVTRAGLTFKYGDKGPIGLVTGKQVHIAMASGGIYSEGPGQAGDFIAPYLTYFLGFLGMTDVTVHRVEGVKIPGIMEHALEKAVAAIQVD